MRTSATHAARTTCPSKPMTRGRSSLAPGRPDAVQSFPAGGESPPARRAESLPMYALLQCVAEAVVAKGVRGLAELVPGGGFLYDIANDAHRRLRDRKRSDQIREEVVSVAAAGIEEVRKVAEQVVAEVAKGAA